MDMMDCDCPNKKQKYYVVTMTDGTKWGVPAHIIAKHKADYYSNSTTDMDTQGCFPLNGSAWQEEFELMMHWFDNNDYEFADWAKNNMDWDDVKDHAYLHEVRAFNVDYQEGWVNGEYSYVVM